MSGLIDESQTLQDKGPGNTAYRKFNTANIEHFKCLFTNTHVFLSHEYNKSTNIDKYFEIFWTEFSYCFENAFPKLNKSKKTQTHSNVKFQFTQKLITESKNLRHLNNMRKLYDCEYLNTIYKSSKKMHIKNIKIEKQLQNKKRIHNSKNKTATLWKIINKKLNRSSGQREIALNHNNCLVSDANTLADVFATHFASTVTNKLKSQISSSTNNECTSMHRNSKTMFFNPASVGEVKNIITALQNKKSTGIDEVPIFLIKQCIDEFTQCLVHIINKSMQLGQFPQRLKTGLIVPIYKKDDENDIKNYRPICLLNVFSKIIERVVADRLTTFLNSFNLLTTSQHGFRSNLSTETAAIELVQYISSKLDSNEFAMGVFFDLSNAFDTLDINFIEVKLEKLGIRGNVCKWLVSWLTKREYYVKMQNSLSKKYEISLGTPQGSVLGPLIFLIYVNELPNFISYGKVIMYADDTSIVISAKTQIELEYKVNYILQQFDHWCSQNRLIVNHNKTVCIKFTAKKQLDNTNYNIIVGQHQIQPQIKTKFLGITLDENLSWSEHMHQLCNKLNRSCFAISILKGDLDQDSLMDVYYAMVYSNLAYNIIVWGQCTDIQRVFIIQKRIIRIIFNLKFRESCRDTFKNKRILTVTGIYLYKILTYIHTIRHKLNEHSDIHNYNTRNCHNIYINNYKLILFKKSPICAGSYLYNRLPLDIKEMVPLKQFKLKLKNYLCDKCIYTIAEYLV